MFTELNSILGTDPGTLTQVMTSHFTHHGDAVHQNATAARACQGAICMLWRHTDGCHVTGRIRRDFGQKEWRVLLDPPLLIFLPARWAVLLEMHCWLAEGERRRNSAEQVKYCFLIVSWQFIFSAVQSAVCGSGSVVQSLQRRQSETGESKLFNHLHHFTFILISSSILSPRS